MHRDMTLAEAAREIHENAKAHGWWDEEREAAEIYALIHSEWSEALEEYRAGRPDRWFSCVAEDTSGVCPERNCNPDLPCVYRGKKPEGICVELIDGVIRILDYMARSGMSEVNGSKTIGEAVHTIGFGRVKGELRWSNVPSIVNGLHLYTSLSYTTHEEVTGIERMALINAIALAWVWIEGRGLDPMELLIEKHEYNKTRPYKHGKVC